MTHILALDLFAGAWIARDALRLGIWRPAVVICLLPTFVLAPLGIAVYLLIRFKPNRIRLARFEQPGDRRHLASAAATPMTQPGGILTG